MEIEGQETNPNAKIFDDMQAVKDGKSPEDDNEQEAAPEVSLENTLEPPEEGSEEPPKKAKYRLAGKEFDSQEEAFAYAEELDRQAAIREAETNAYRQAIMSQQQAQNLGQSVTQPEEDDFDAKFYENPKEYLKQMAEQVRQQTREEVLRTVEDRSEEEKLWGEFFSENPDLSGFRRDCEMVLDDHKEQIAALAQTRGKKAASDYLAQKTRAKFQQWADAQKPRREIPDTRRGASSGAAQSVTPKQGDEKPMSFAEQMRTISKG